VYPDVSPDGDRLAYTQARKDQRDVLRYRLPQERNQIKNEERLVYEDAIESSAIFSPDGTRIAYLSDLSGYRELWVCDSSGTNRQKLTDRQLDQVGSPSWSRDNKSIAFDSWSGEHMGIFVISANGGIPRKITPDTVSAGRPTWSRDGEWIYHNSSGSVCKTPSDGGSPIVVVEGGNHPKISPDGEWLYYMKLPRQRPGRLWRMPVKGGQESLMVERVLSGPYWVVFDDGIYYADYMQGDSGSFSYWLNYYDISSKSTEIVGDFEDWQGEIDISPDRKYILTSTPELHSGTVNLVMLENWR
jgi:Tol biopolymer transport system component